LDKSANFDKDNRYPYTYESYHTEVIRYIVNDDSMYYSMIKMRQFYPHFIGVPYEKEFSSNLYYVKSILEKRR